VGSGNVSGIIQFSTKSDVKPFFEQSNVLLKLWQVLSEIWKRDPIDQLEPKPAYFSDRPASTATASLKNLVPTQALNPEIKFEIPTPDGVRQFESKEVDESLICEVRGMGHCFLP